MKTKYFCRRCGEQLMGDGGWCHVCRENREDYSVEERYFPDDPANKVYAVDAYVTVCKCFYVEAKDRDAASAKVEDMIGSMLDPSTEAESCYSLADMGFHDAEEMETTVSGEADENGEINYY